jgi:hypothetical protein
VTVCLIRIYERNRLIGVRYFTHYRLICLICFWAVICTAGSEALGSNQYWPAAGIVWDVNGPWMFKFKETHYYFKGDSKSDHSKSDVTAVFKGPMDVFDFGLGFAYVDGGEERKQESRPYVSATMRAKLFDRDWANRFMIEYRDFSGSSDYWRFRDKVMFNSFFDSLDARGMRLLNRDRFRPYAADEVFFNSNGQGFSQNRVYLGLQIKLIQNVAADVYYLLQSVQNSSNSWENNNIIGTELTLRF